MVARDAPGNKGLGGCRRFVGCGSRGGSIAANCLVGETLYARRIGPHGAPGSGSFYQMLTSFTLAPGESVVFAANLPLKDRSGQQLYGIYQARAFLTTSDPQPRVSASTV